MEVTFGNRSSEVVGPLIASRSLTGEEDLSSTLNKMSFSKQKQCVIDKLNKELMQKQIEIANLKINLLKQQQTNNQKEHEMKVEIYQKFSVKS